MVKLQTKSPIVRLVDRTKLKSTAKEFPFFQNFLKKHPFSGRSGIDKEGLLWAKPYFLLVDQNLPSKTFKILRKIAAILPK